MDKQFLNVQEGAVYSPAVVYLATRLKTLRFTDKREFIKHMTARTDGMQFSKAEALRIWDALHSVVYYYDEKEHTGLNANHKLTFPRNWYTNSANSFENYANDLMIFHEIVKQMGCKKGDTTRGRKANGKAPTEKQLAHLADMRARRAANIAAKKAAEESSKEVTSISEEISTFKTSDIVYDECTGDFVPKEQPESSVASVRTLEDYSDEDLLAELQRREDARKAAAEFARKKSLVEEFLAAYDMTKEDLLEIAEVI